MRKLASSSLSVTMFAALLLAGCGGYNSQYMAPTTSTSPSQGTTTAVVNFGDDPADSVLSLEITINSILLTDASSQQTSVLSTPIRIEVTRLAGTFSALARVNIPQGTYTSAVVTVANPEISFINSAGKKVDLSPQLMSTAINVVFSPSLVIGTTPSAFNFDFDVAKSVIFDAAGVPSLNPVITIVPVAAAPTAGFDPEHGDVDDLKGTVTGVTATYFTVGVHDGAQSLLFNVDSSTQFSGITALSGLKSGMQVEVSAAVQADGSLLAKRVEAEVELENEQASGANLEGLITATTGSPVTQISILVRDLESMMAGAPVLGSTVNAQLSGSTKFAIDSSDLTLTSLGFTPVFDATTISKGQNVEIDTDLSAASPSASKVKLSKQALRGTASAVNAGASVTTFTLTLPSDSAFTALTGATNITVYQTSTTQLKGLSSVASGSSLRVRGLLFFDGTAYRFVARSIAKL